ncbi:MAG: hypothetical protein HY903_15165 [Deltaproteobacteria bacterium]|nr:hypothetical protein [Deltaproteobacteria bacterium]
MQRSLSSMITLVALLALPIDASANASGVGLGVAAGADIQHGKVQKNKANFAWGFFVDIPVAANFYITPQTTVYEMKRSTDKEALTDVDLNFKFLVPLGFATLGAGLTAGLTTGLGDYLGHYGALGYFALNLVSNLDAFAMVQFKRLAYGGDNIDNYHGYLGGIWRF